MNSAPQENPATTSLTAPASNALLRRVIIISTILSLATADGWMASFQRQPGGELSCRWCWATLIWGLIGGGTGLYFWRQIWPPPNQPRATRKQIMIGSVVLLLPCLWWLTFPLRFLSGPDFRDVTCGLIAAAIVLSFGAGMVIKLIRAFERSDTLDLENETPPNPGTSAGKSPEKQNWRGT
jgi:peptidoglycan/LPS O-acetylase OafA/YrhL